MASQTPELEGILRDHLSWDPFVRKKDVAICFQQVSLDDKDEEEEAIEPGLRLPLYIYL